MLRIIALLLLWIALPVHADDAPELLPDPPDLPPPVQSGQPMEPDVTVIRKEGGEVVEEHRINNRLYMIKVKPIIGPAYYLLDKDGDGNMDVRRNFESGEQNPNVNQWVLFSW
ncbi:DUF2782 domain-containing protein [Methylomagnum ishizawai]|uniref:DUF2782 domain-containing protein n=1 Tax=Methylomagnum ishizawai TaxID=1760988 RepID=UPI001C3313B7|nr:DUF2782 domain-containing protein [Methylomagnum ishizawai]BBL75906.1 hypothetical protein MishRS11D_30040 [Methylomagnum ishizawai]